MKLRSAIVLSIYLVISFSASAKTRIKDIATVETMRENLLVGQGLVVGLAGTGDNLRNAVFTEKGLTDFLERLGTNVQGSHLRTKNIAAVTVTANLPTFARMGNKIDVKVSAIGDAKSLKGGILLATPLLGADSNVYAVAQGAVSIAEFTPASRAVRTRSNSVLTNGYIQSGAIIKNELDFCFAKLDKVNFSLYSSDFVTSSRVASAINKQLSNKIATAIDARTIEVIIPDSIKNNVVEFIAAIESLEIQPDYKAKIVINESTGTVVIGDKVNVRPVAIAQGNLIVNITPPIDQEFGPNTDEGTRELVDRFVDNRRGKELYQLNKGTTLSDLVVGLNKLGVYPRDIINILYNMKSAGALDAVIEVR